MVQIDLTGGAQQIATRSNFAPAVTLGAPSRVRIFTGADGLAPASA